MTVESWTEVCRRTGLEDWTCSYDKKDSLRLCGPMTNQPPRGLSPLWAAIGAISIDFVNKKPSYL